MTSRASWRDSRASATSWTSEIPRPISAAPVAAWPASPSAANAKTPQPPQQTTFRRSSAQQDLLALAEHNVENCRAVRSHVPPDRLVTRHLEVEVERRG